ncbi:MAG TPA: tetratricopeptide repeat protein [candidate division WOR-3 bacterium]|uniref:Tetratricopeptide repeat protein n=1 Tax=candidate division WOR-3 bacterium TaxID=2052148 RepID=A0A7C0VCZ0_UNCW3|nr:tetratricopeptide repeat protein [candidate division WOR-3 bacterium]
MGKTEKITELKIKAKNAMTKNKLDEAIQLYEKILSLNPEDPVTMNEIAEAYKKKGDLNNARKYLWDALEAYKNLEYYPNATAIAKKLLNLGEDELEIMEIMADLYSKQGLIGDAISTYYGLAEKFMKENDIDGVLTTYKKIVELTPKKADIRLKLADIFVSQEKIDEAIEQYQEVEKIYREQGRVDDADQIKMKIAQLRGEAVEEAPAQPSEAGKAGEEEFVFEQAKPVFEESKETAPVEEAEPLVEEEVAESIEEELVSAIEGEDTIVGVPQPETASVEKAVSDWMDWVTLAELYESVQSIDDAVEYYTKAADYFFETGDYERAEELYAKISKLKPFELRPIQKLIQIALKTNDKSKAIEAYISLHICLKKRGAEEEAQKALEKALKIDPHHPALQEYFPELAVQEEVKEEVKEEKVAKEEKKEEVVAEINFEELLKEEEEAISIKLREPTPGEENIDYLLEQFKEKIFENISTEDFSSHYDLGLSYKEMGLIDEAINEFKIAMRGERERLKSLEMLGQCYEDKGELKTAELIYKRAIEKETQKDPVKMLAFHYHLGDIYARQGKLKEAIKEFKEIVEIDPEFGDVKEKIKELSKQLMKSAPAKS